MDKEGEPSGAAPRRRRTDRFTAFPPSSQTAVTPTKARPPNFFVVGEWEKRPGQEELSQAMAGAELVLENTIKEMADSVSTEARWRDWVGGNVGSV